MQQGPTPDARSAPVALVQGDPASGAEAALLRERVALFALVGLGVSVAIEALSLLLPEGVVRPAGASAPPGPLDLAFWWIPGLFAAAWGMSRPFGRDPGLLRALETGTTLAAALTLAVLTASDGLPWLAVRPVGYLLLLRSVFVPSTPHRTAVVAGACVISPAVAILLVSTGTAPLAEAIHALARGAVDGAVAVAISAVIYGLRREARKATRLGQYRIEEKIGEGGMGVVYRAVHSMLRRPTAVKVLRPDRADQRSLVRFEREVRMTCRLSHPNTVVVYDYGRTLDGTFYYAMELLDGADIGDLVRRHGPQEEARVLHVLKAVCGSLAEAHDLGLVHRDVKPSNVLLCHQGRAYDVVKVVDFGLVKDTRRIVRGDVDLTAPDAIVGTPHYMSPEAIEDSTAVGPRSDLYSLGSVAYYMLTGRPPFPGRGLVDIAVLKMEKAPPPPSEVAGRTIDDDLEGIVMRCLEREPDRRFPDAGSLGEALDDCRQTDAWTPAAARRWWIERRPGLFGRRES